MPWSFSSPIWDEVIKMGRGKEKVCCYNSIKRRWYYILLFIDNSFSQGWSDIESMFSYLNAACKRKRGWQEDHLFLILFQLAGASPIPHREQQQQQQQQWGEVKNVIEDIVGKGDEKERGEKEQNKKTHIGRERERMEGGSLSFLVPRTPLWRIRRGFSRLCSTALQD